MAGSTAPALAGTGVDAEPETVAWIVSAVRAVVRSAVQVAQLRSFRIPSLAGGGESWWAPVFGWVSWSAVPIGAGLAAVSLIRALRNGQRRADIRVGMWAAVIGLVAVLAVVALTDALSALVLERPRWAAALAAIPAEPPPAEQPHRLGATGVVDVLAVLGFGVAALLYLMEFVARLAGILLLVVAVPVMAATVSVPGLSGAATVSRWWPRLVCVLRWVVVAVLAKPALVLFLVAGMVEIGPVGGTLALGGAVAVVVFGVCGPITLVQALDVGLAARSTGGGRAPVCRAARSLSLAPKVSAVSHAAGRPVSPCGGAGTSAGPAERSVAGRRRGRHRRRSGPGVSGVVWPCVREVRDSSLTRLSRASTGPHPRESHRPDEEERVPVGAGSGGVVHRRSSDDGPVGCATPEIAVDAVDHAGAEGSPATRPSVAAEPAEARPGRAEPGTAGHAHDARPGHAGSELGVSAAAGESAGWVWSVRVLGRPAVHAIRTGPADVHIAHRTDDDGDDGGAGDAVVRDAAGPGGVEVTARLSARMRELLVFLAVHPYGVRRDAVVAALWPETGRRRPANNLSALLTRLRTATAAARPCGEVAAELVVVDGEIYQLDPAVVQVDWWEFLSGVNADWANTLAPPTEKTLAGLQRAHGLYRGLLAEGVGAEWVLSLREAGRRSFLAVTARLVRHYIATDQPGAALRVLERARNLDPTNEHLYRDIIALQLKMGDNDGAAYTLRLLESQLADIEEGVSDTIVELARHIATSSVNRRGTRRQLQSIPVETDSCGE